MSVLRTTVLLVIAVSCVSAVLECRQYSGNCVSCLQDPTCGYCGTTGACVAGNTNGPYVGNCSAWEFDSCGATAPPTGPPAPTSTPTPSDLTNVWATYGGNSARTGYSPASTNALNNKTVVVAANINCATSPITTEKYAVCMTQPCNVVAVSLSTGQVAWNASLQPSASYLSPLYYDADSRKVIAQVNLENEGTLIAALQVDTGLLNWTYQDSSQWPNLPYGLVGHNGMVFAPVGSQTSYVVALQIADGAFVWTSEGYGADAGCDRWGPTVAMINGSAQVLWNKQTGESNPAMVGAFDATSGASQWTISFPDAWAGYSANWYAVDAGNGIILATPWSNDVTSITAMSVDGNATPSILWQYNVSGQQGGVVSVANDIVYFHVIAAEQVLALTLQTGSLVKVYSATSIASHPLVTVNSLFTTVASNNCVAQFSIASAAVESTFCPEQPGESFWGLAFAAKSKLVVAAYSQNIYIIGTD